ncbi:hypothetical protein, partial [Mesorhizobium sp.]|uniref:hypothetical protein n=1 Tax=Mesorhizobium sp. TaxID=1871066 RepID=UPI0025FA81D7
AGSAASGKGFGLNFADLVGTPRASGSDHRPLALAEGSVAGPNMTRSALVKNRQPLMRTANADQPQRPPETSTAFQSAMGRAAIQCSTVVRNAIMQALKRATTSCAGEPLYQDSCADNA